jgi:hypothetical protein
MGLINFISETAKSLWTGILHALAMFLLIAVGSWLIAQIPAVKEWATAQLLSLGAPERASLTIFLSVLSLILLVLWIVARISLYKLNSIATTFEPIEQSPETIERPPEQVAILQHLSKSRGDYISNMGNSLRLDPHVTEYHVNILWQDEFIDRDTGMNSGYCRLLHNGTGYLIAHGMLK